MQLFVERFTHDADSSVALLFVMAGPTSKRRFECFVLEDEPREVKLVNETRTPDGTYQIKLRTEGGFHQRYVARFPGHKGMLWLQDVPDFTYVLIHCGNTDDDTSGCLLVGATATVNKDGGGTISDSTGAYLRLYPQVLAALQRGEPVSITITSRDG